MQYKFLRSEIAKLIGFERNTTSHGEKLLSATGAALGILGICMVMAIAGMGASDDPAATLLIASMGASAVLLFAVPHGALSQPWALCGGHLVSAAIGVTCRQWLDDSVWAAATAVGTAVAAMCYLRCIHPPGGATALTAVIGGEQIQALGYAFVLYPVLANVAIIIVVAALFNSPFQWRRYPAHLTHLARPRLQPQPAAAAVKLTQEDFFAAMQELDSYIDISAEGLVDLLELATRHAEANVEHPADIIPGRFYSNGQLGAHWSVRQVVDSSTNPVPAQGKVIFKVVAGRQAFETGICLKDEFRNWARFEVESQCGRWTKVRENQKYSAIAG